MSLFSWFKKEPLFPPTVRVFKVSFKNRTFVTIEADETHSVGGHTFFKHHGSFVATVNLSEVTAILIGDKE